jgi:UPF0755 protein
LRVSRLAKIAGLAAYILAAGAAAASIWFWHAFNAAGPLAVETTFVIPKGMGVSQIAGVLEAQGVIDDALVFTIGARLLARGQPLHAGEFNFPRAVSTRSALETLIAGNSVLHRLTVAEGLTVRQVFDQLAAETLLDGSLPAFPAEGELLPETYFFVRGDARSALVDRMRESMNAALNELWAARDPSLSIKTAQEALILASIVEKETGQNAERARVAAVFLNRLKKNMPLQSDPTVIYALTLGQAPLDRPLTQADLRTQSPFNTYVVAGLPPAPIANPGLSALQAVMNPAVTDEYYFVADGSGGHAFARTLDEHNRNVARWRQIERQQQTD